MAIAKRVFLYCIVNIFVVASLLLLYAVVLMFLPPEYQDSYLEPLILFSVLFGFGGAIISLLLSKFVAKKFMGVKIISPSTHDPKLRWVLETTHRLSKRAGLMKMPEVGYYESREINAFATGPSKNNSLVAVSSGLLNNMNENGVEGVIGHEVAHIANGDMVTMTLVQGVVNAVVICLAQIIVQLIDNALRGNRSRGGLGFFGRIFIYQMIYSLLAFAAMPIVAFVSRIREYRADAGGAKLAGRDKMIEGLRELKQFHDHIETSHKSLATLKIAGKNSFLRFWSTHPPLDDRIKRLQTRFYAR